MGKKIKLCKYSGSSHESVCRLLRLTQLICGAGMDFIFEWFLHGLDLRARLSWNTSEAFVNSTLPAQGHEAEGIDPQVLLLPTEAKLLRSWAKVRPSISGGEISRDTLLTPQTVCLPLLVTVLLHRSSSSPLWWFTEEGLHWVVKLWPIFTVNCEQCCAPLSFSDMQQNAMQSGRNNMGLQHFERTLLIPGMCSELNHEQQSIVGGWNRRVGTKMARIMGHTQIYSTALIE